MPVFPTLPGATPITDASGLLLKIATQDQLYEAEGKNIAKAAFKYLSSKPSKRTAPFDYAWMLKLHEEMYSDVWAWAGQIRKNVLSIGLPLHQIRESLAALAGDLAYWKESGMDLIEQAVRLHHRAVQIHPFENGNGRWSRMLGDIWLKQHNGKIPIWPTDINRDSPIRDEYIAAVKLADRGDFEPLLNLYQKNSVN